MNRVIHEDINLILKEKLPWDILNNKKILITGASGFIGSYLVWTMLEINKKGYNITIYALCRDKQKALKKFNDYLHDPNLRLIYQDVCNELSDDLKCDIIIHAASPTNYSELYNNPYEAINANVIAYDNIIKKAKMWNVQELLLFSSSAVYGYSSPLKGADEKFRCSIDFSDTKDVYALSKQMAEMMTSCMIKSNNIITKIVRPFVVYGSGDSLNGKKAIIDFLNDILNHKDVVLKSDGRAIRSYIYISDAVSAVFYVLLNAQSGVYNICENDNYSIRQIAEMLCELSENSNVVYKFDNSEYLKNKTSVMIGNNDNLIKLGWTKKVSIKDGLKRMIQWGIIEKENYEYYK